MQGTEGDKMITLRRSSERGRTKLNRLDSRGTFSFGDYYDPQYMAFRQLRVINEDRVNPGAGFPTHSHRDMEIITYVMEGGASRNDFSLQHTVTQILAEAATVKEATPHPF
jgi:quercetin 2,3-dioxygenase